MTDPAAGGYPPPPQDGGPTAPPLAWLVVGAAAVLVVIAFAVGLPAYTYWGEGGLDGMECGSVLMPNLVSTFYSGECQHELLPARLATMGLAAGAIALAGAAAAKSGSVGRMHTRAWHASLVVGVASAFLLLWTLLAWAVALFGAYEPS